MAIEQQLIQAGVEAAADTFGETEVHAQLEDVQEKVKLIITTLNEQCDTLQGELTDAQIALQTFINMQKNAFDLSLNEFINVPLKATTSNGPFPVCFDNERLLETV